MKLANSWLLAALALLLCLVPGRETTAGTLPSLEWTAVGPHSGGIVLSVAVDRSASTTIYAGLDAGGVYKSTDSGATWGATSSGGIVGLSVYTLVVHPATSVVYAGTNNGLFQSNDGGMTWTSVSSGITGQYVVSLAFQGNTMYAGTNAGAFSSSDGGASWASIPGLESLTVYSLVSDGGAQLYAGTSAGVFRSGDGGTIWTPQNQGLTSSNVQALAVHPTIPSILYAGTWGGGVFKTVDGGETWAPATNGTTDAFIRRLTINPLSPETLYACTNSGVFVTTSGGNQWSLASSGPRNVASYDVALTPAAVFAATTGGMFRSVDGGVNWTSINAGISTLNVQAVVVDTLVAGMVYAGANGNAFRSSDRGNVWNPITDGLGSLNVHAIAADPSTPGVLLAGTDIGVYRSQSYGNTWNAINNGLGTPAVSAVVLKPGASAIMYAGTTEGVFKTTNGGFSWAPVNNGITQLRIRALAVSASSPDTLYAGTEEGIFKSTDGGGLWSHLADSPDFVNALAVAPAGAGSEDVVFAGTDTSVYRSDNGGTTWLWARNGITNAFVNALAFDPTTSPATIYAGTDGGVFSSTSNGDLWTPLNAGLTNLKVRAIAFDQSKRTIFAGTAGSGVFRLAAVDLTVSPAPLSFGDVPLHTTSAATAIEISNTSGTPVVMTSIALVGGESSLFGLSLGTCGSSAPTLAPGASCTVTVAFSPTQLGTSTTTLRIASNSLNYPTLDVNVTGTGVLQAYGLSVTAAGEGSGTIHVSSGENCSGICLLSFPSGTTLTLTAIPDADSLFSRWNGCDSETPAGACKVTMDGPKTIDATFNAQPRLSPLFPWQSANLNGQNVNQLVADPSDPSTLYAATDTGVHRGSNGGAAWEAMTAGLTGFPVKTVWVDPTMPSTLLAGTTSGIFSSNGGIEWVKVTTDPVTLDTNAFAADPSTPGTIYAATAAGVFKSTDGGTSWTGSGLASMNVAVLAITSHTPPILYAGTTGAGGGLFTSTDGGTSWQPVTTGLSDVRAIAVHPATPDTVLIGGLNEESEAEVIGTTNGGTTWPMRSGPLSGSIKSVAIDASSGAFYAGTSVGALVSLDGGSTWNAITTGIEGLAVNSVAIAGTTPAATVYAGTSNGVYRLTSAGIVLTPEAWVFPYPDGIRDETVLKVATGTTTEAAQFTITNDGTSALTVHSIVVTGSDSAEFVLEFDPGPGRCASGSPTLSPGESCSFSASFNPVTTGMKSATLRISSNDPVAALKYATLSGEAYDPPPYGSIIINGGATAVSTTAVTLTLAAFDNSGVVADMRVSNSTSFWGGWEPFSASKAWTLSSGDGTKHVHVQFRDGAGNVSGTFSSRIVLNSLPPVATITSMPVAQYTSRSGTFSFTADQPDSTFQCRIDGASFAPCASPYSFSGLSDGSHLFEVKATNSAGMTQTVAASYTWVIDTVPPETALLSTPPASTFAVPAAFTFTGEGGSSFQCSMDTQEFAPCTSPYSVGSLTAGSHSFRVRAVDAAGNADPTAAAFSWTVLSPTTTIDSSPPNPANVSTATFTFSSNAPGTTFECSLDNGPYASCTSPATFSNLSTASHVFSVRARDAAGNYDLNPPRYTWNVQSGPIKFISGTGGVSFFTTLNAAFGAITPGSDVEILMQNILYSGDAVLAADGTIRLKGGYDSSFSTVVQQTMIQGTVTVERGTLVVADLIIM